MFHPGNLEALAAERRQEFEREAERIRLLASLRGPRQGWRERLGYSLQAVGEQVADWGYRLATPQASGYRAEARVVAVKSDDRCWS